MEPTGLDLDVVALWADRRRCPPEVLPTRCTKSVTEHPVPGTPVTHLETSGLGGEDREGLCGIRRQRLDQLGTGTSQALTDLGQPIVPDV